MAVKIHAAADIFPMLADAAYDALKADIEKNGQREPVVYYKGELVDGRNRLQACEELGLEAADCELDEDIDPVAYVLSANLHRRQLKTSQKAMCAAKLAGLSEGRPSKTVSNDTVSAEHAANLFDIGRASVFRALDVLRGGSAYLIQQCELGQLTVSLAAKLIEAVPEKKEQTRIAKEGKQAIRDAAGVAAPSKAATDVVAELDKAAKHTDAEAVVSAVDSWLLAQDERPRFEVFKTLWDSSDDIARAAIRAFVMDE